MKTKKIPEMSPETMKTFLSHIDKSGDCHVWTMKPVNNGYAAFRIKGVMYSVHRVAYNLYVGNCDGKEVCHKCDNPICLNPAHLFLGTHKENMRDMFSKNRRRHVIGVNKPNAILDETKVKEIRSYKKPVDFEEIGKRYNISPKTARNVFNNISWKHVK